MIRLRLLGGASLEQDGTVVRGRAAQNHHLALLAVLAAAPGRTAGRERLIGLLWGDLETRKARHRLSVVLHVVRRQLGLANLDEPDSALVWLERTYEADRTAIKMPFERIVAARRCRWTGPTLLAAAVACAPSAPGPDDEQAVQSVVQSLEDALNARDWAAFFTNFTEEADLVVFGSPRAEGRPAARALMEAGWEQIPSDVRGELTVESMRFPNPAVAVVDIAGEFSGSMPSHDRATALLTSTAGEWRIEAFRIMQPEPTGSWAADLPDAVTADPAHYSVEFENSVLRLLRIRYGARERSTMHAHPASCAVFVTTGAFRMTLPDGSSTEGEPGTPGSVVCVDSESHLPENVGDRPVEAILVELKDRATLAP